MGLATSRYQSAAFKAAASRIHTINFGQGWTSEAANLVLTMLPNLKTVKLDGFVADDSLDYDRGVHDTSLSATLQSLVGLQELNFDDPSDQSSGYVSPLWQRPWRSSGTLRMIRIQARYIRAGLWQMVESLGGSLEVLQVCVGEFRGDFENDVSTQTSSTIPPSFPRLKRLTIERSGNFETPIAFILSRLDSAPILDITVDILTYAALIPVLKQFPTLQRLTLIDLHEGDRLEAEEHHKIAVECTARSIELRIESFGVPSKRVTDLVPDETPEEDAALALNLAAVRRTLDFGFLRLERARVDKDVNWDVEASMLAPLEKIRLAWED